MRFEGFPQNSKDLEPEQPYDAAAEGDSLSEAAAIPEIESTLEGLSARGAGLEGYAHSQDGAHEEELMLSEEQANDLKETLSRFQDKSD